MLYILAHYICLFAVFIFFWTYIRWSKKRTLRFLEVCFIKAIDMAAWFYRLRKQYEEDSPAASIVFYNLEGKEITKMEMKINQKLKVSVGFKDKAGNAAKVDGLPQWELSDAALGALVVAEDGLSADFSPAGGIGLCDIKVKADADLGEGVKAIEGQLPLDIQAGEAEVVELSAVIE
jgi:hypothetical protein